MLYRPAVLFPHQFGDLRLLIEVKEQGIEAR